MGVGGDEVQYQCWNSSPKMQAYLKQRNLTGVQLYQEFEYRMFAILKKLGKDAVTWDSTFQTGMKMPPGSVIHQYQGDLGVTATIAKAGLRVIQSLGVAGPLTYHSHGYCQELAEISQYISFGLMAPNPRK